MVKLDPVEILKRHGLYTDEVQTRMDMIDAVMRRDWESPALTKNLTREQLDHMKGQPLVQSGGAFSIPKGLLDKAKSVASIPEAKDIAAQGAALGAMGMSGLEDVKGKVGSLKDEAMGKVGELNAFKDRAMGAIDGFKKGGPVDEGPEAMARRAAVASQIGEFVGNLPPVKGVKKTFAGKDPVTGLAAELDYEPSDGFLTMVVKMFLNAVSDVVSSPALPIYVRAVFGINFLLSYLQGLPIFGGLIRAALEITSFVVTTTGTTILSLGNMAGPIGHIIGLTFASVFFVLAALIAYSRKQFTDALVISANLIPFVGMPISNALQRADITAKKLYEAQKKVYYSFIDLLALVFEVKGRVRGGIRFSRRRKSTKKWRTMRRRFVRR